MPCLTSAAARHLSSTQSGMPGGARACRADMTQKCHSAVVGAAHTIPLPILVAAAGRFRMKRARLPIMLLGLAFCCCAATAGRSEPLRIALVIANGQYANFPAA